MSAKPSTIPVFDSGAVNVATPSAGRIANGFPNGTIPTAGEMNYLFMWLYLWTQYLSDGNFTGAATFASTLGVTGLITATAGVTCGANTHVAVSGTGMYKRGTRVRHLPGTAAQITSTPAATTQYYSGSAIQFRATNNIFSFPLELEEGEQLQSVRAYTVTSTGDTVTMKVFKNTPVVGSTGPTDVQLGTTQTDAAHGALVVQLAVTGLTENVPNTPISYRVEVQCTAFTTSPFCYGIDYTTTVP